MDHGAAVMRSPQFASLRYAVNGAICALINNAILIVGDWLGGGHLFLVFLTWLVGGSAGFALHARVSFRAEAGRTGYVQFMAGVALGMPVAYASILLLTVILHLPMTLAAPIATVVMILYNYVNARLAILKTLRSH